ncbi:MAG: NADPH-dependent FMN reductase [Peptostreptococcaceae bacterium]|nr:NADPH-dependent FMN reductase [Peptostreptococcaceae bacterium]
MKKKKILAIVGSLREKSYNKQLAMLVKEQVGDRADFEILDYREVPFFNEDIEEPVPKSVARVRAQVEEADGIWFFNPEYNHFFSGVLKNLLDWLSRAVPNKEPLLAKKPAALSGTTIGMSGTLGSQNHLVTLLSISDMDIMNKPRLTIPHIKNQLDEKGNVALTDSKELLEKQVEAFLAFLDR